MSDDAIKIAEFYSSGPAPWQTVAVVEASDDYVWMKVRSGDVTAKVSLTTNAARALGESLLKAAGEKQTRYSEFNWLFKDGADVPWPECDSSEDCGGEET
jgi:hypothetical protein